jgi:beta-galactosidase
MEHVMKTRAWKAVMLLALAARAADAAATVAAAPSAPDLRSTTPLDRGWKFLQDDKLTDAEALQANGVAWQPVDLPHTWNAKDAAGTDITKPYKRGIGWYRLEFDTPAKGARKWLEFGAASIVSDVWLNGKKLGEHKGAFTVFRFDVTDRLARGGKNVLVVKCDNRAPTKSTDPTAIIPLAGDFNMSGGLYRYVSLVATADPVHFDLGDMGGPGVYATTKSISGDGAIVDVRARVKSDATQDGEYTLRASLVGADGQVAQRAERPVSLKAGAGAQVTQELAVQRPHLWQGVQDPYLYRLVVELTRRDGAPVDRVAQRFGIREMRFDPQQGFFLNGKHVPLHGVAVHQDLLGKAWAISHADMDGLLALVKEIGANTVRLAHYPYAEYVLDRLDELGLVAWAEVPFGIGVTVEPPIELGQPLPCPTDDATPAFRANARQQLQEQVRQEYNHAAIGMWAVGNETTFLAQDCTSPPHDNVTPVLRELHALAKKEDPGRATTLADFTEDVLPSNQAGYIAVGGITDVWAINQYYLWYGGPVSGLGARLDALHARYPGQPLGMSEYGAGAALSQHTDNPLGGPPEVTNTGEPVIYQPEEYASYVHEQNYAMLLSKPYMWGTYVWNLVDFGSGLRNEGDLRGVNTKGLVTFDHETRKDPFYFYKANWSREPVTYVTGRRYTHRLYPVADVKVYSNAASVQLSVNGKPVGTMTKERCPLGTCVFPAVALSPGANEIVAVGDHGGNAVRDAVKWTLDARDVNIAAGQLATGFKASRGAVYGSDNFFIGGVGDWLVGKSTSSPPDQDRTKVSGTEDPQLFANYRRGAFSYLVPLADGTYSVTLGFIEPAQATAVGNRVFDVVANGEKKLENFDVLAAAGAYRKAVTRSFTTTVSGGRLELDFKPVRGEAVVSNIAIRNVRLQAAGGRQ